MNEPGSEGAKQETLRLPDASSTADTKSRRDPAMSAMVSGSLHHEPIATSLRTAHPYGGQQLDKTAIVSDPRGHTSRKSYRTGARDTPFARVSNESSIAEPRMHPHAGHVHFHWTDPGTTPEGSSYRSKQISPQVVSEPIGMSETAVYQPPHRRSTGPRSRSSSVSSFSMKRGNASRHSALNLVPGRAQREYVMFGSPKRENAAGGDRVRPCDDANY